MLPIGCRRSSIAVERSEARKRSFPDPRRVGGCRPPQSQDNRHHTVNQPANARDWRKAGDRPDFDLHGALLFATVLKRAGANIAYISESLGHQELKTTENGLASFEQRKSTSCSGCLAAFALAPGRRNSAQFGAMRKRGDFSCFSRKMYYLCEPVSPAARLRAGLGWKSTLQRPSGPQPAARTGRYAQAYPAAHLILNLEF